MPEQKVRVRVQAPWRVVDPEDGKPYTDGDELAVSEKLADEWTRSRFVERVTSKEKS
jgi:hypothetical protein